MIQITFQHQVAIIYAGTQALLKDIPTNKVKEFEKEFIEVLEAKHRNILDTIKSGKLTDEVTDTLKNVAAQLTANYKVTEQA